MVDNGQSDPYVTLAAQPELSMKYSARLLKMVDRCCALHISERPTSASEIARELNLSHTSAPVIAPSEPMTAALPKIALASDQVMNKFMQRVVVLSKVTELPKRSDGSKPNPLLFSLFLIALAALVTLIAYYVLEFQGVLS